jgi:hypothetical protein
MKPILLSILLACTGVLAACEKAAPPFDPLPAAGDQELGIDNPVTDKLYRNTTPEINSLEQRNQLQDWSGWYRHRGHYYVKGNII